MTGRSQPQTVVLKYRRQAGQDWVPAFAGMSGDVVPHRSFSVARPASASMAETIQKRITTVDSGQPIFSK